MKFFVGAKFSDKKLILSDTLKRKIYLINNIDLSFYNKDSLLYSKELKKIFQINNKIIFSEKCYEDRIIDFYKFYNSVRNSKQMNLTLDFGEDCNLNCKYCYEDKNIPYDKNLNISLLYDFIVKYVSQNEISNIHFELYGGEPLLYKDLIVNFLHKMKESKLSYDFSIMTNGTLYDKEFYQYLIENGLKKVEISLDGPEHIHEKMRPMKSGQNGYTLIVSNLQKLVEITSVVVRVNVGKYNISYLKKLMNDLEKFDLKKKIFIYFTPIIHPSLQLDFNKPCYELGNLYEYALKQGFCIPMRLYSSGPCYLQKNHSYAVLSDNAICKCIAIKNTRVENTELFDKSGCKSQIKISSECERCDLLPICFGGCQYKDTECSKLVFESILPRFLRGKGEYYGKTEKNGYYIC